MALARRLGCFGLPVVAVALVGCGGGDDGAGPLLPLTSFGTPASDESLPQWDNYAAHVAYISEINAARRDAFDSPALGIDYSSVLYTAAVRHAGYLDSINSGEGRNGSDAENIVIETTYTALADETVIPKAPDDQSGIDIGNEPIWPVFFTDTTVRNRVLAVHGGPDLIAGRTVYEDYLVNSGTMFYGNPGSAGILISEFRAHSGGDSFGLSGYSDAMNMWHHPFMRLMAMRPSTKYLGIGLKNDARARNNGYIPPFPLLDDKFAGVVLWAEDTAPIIPIYKGIWPPPPERNGGVLGVTGTIGFDGLQVAPDSADESRVPPASGFTGPIISITQGTVSPIVSAEVELYRVFPVAGVENPTDPTSDFEEAVGYALTMNDFTGRPNTGNATECFVYTELPVAGPWIDVSDPDSLNRGFSIRNDGNFFFGYNGPGAGGGGGGLTPTEILTNGDILYIDANGSGRVDPIVGSTGISPDLTLFEDLGEYVRDDAGNTLVISSIYTGTALVRFGPTVDLQTLGIQAGDQLIIPPYDDPHTPGADGLGRNRGTYNILAVLERNRLRLETTMPVDEIDRYLDTTTTTPITESPAPATIIGFRDGGGGNNSTAALRGNELMIIPADPLVPGSYYRCRVRTNNAGLTPRKDTDGDGIDDAWFFADWVFRTAGTTPVEDPLD